MARASDMAHLVFHLFAHMDVPPSPESALDPHINFYDLAYRKWARKNLPERAWRLADEEGTLLSVMVMREPRASVLRALFGLFRDIAHFRGSARFPVETLTQEDVTDLRALDRLRDIDRALVEIARDNLRDLSVPYEEAFTKTVAPAVSAALESCSLALSEAQTLMPALDDFRLHLVYSLGRRAAAFQRDIYIGCPCDWNAMSMAEASLNLMHACARKHAFQRTRGKDPSIRRLRASFRSLTHITKLVSDSAGQLRDGLQPWLEMQDFRRYDNLPRSTRIAPKRDLRRLIDEPQERSEILLRMALRK